MTIQTADLPAHNVWPMLPSGGPTVHDPECLSDPSGTGPVSSPVIISRATGGIAVGATSAGSGGGGALGFGKFTLPAGASFITAKFVAKGHAVGGGSLAGIADPFGGADYFYNGSGGFYRSPVTAWPAITVDYSGDASPFEVLSGFPTSDAEVLEPVNQASWALSTGPLGPNGLCPEFDPYADYPASDDGAYVSLIYLAIRVFYDDGVTAATPVTFVPQSTVVPPLRQYPRSDGLGTSSARRHWPPPKSQQFSNRRAGGYL